MKWKTKLEIQRFAVFFLKHFFQTLRNNQLTMEVALSPSNLTTRMINLNVWECIQECSKSSRETVEPDRKKLNQDLIN